jgi:AcrR family transcriptional regulator
MTLRDKLITSAIEMVRRHGVAGTGVAALLSDSGVARRSLYLNFPGGKTELATAATEVAGQAIDAAIGKALRTEASIPDALDWFVESWKRVLIDSDFEAGCPIVAAAVARSEASTAADVASTIFADWERRLAERVRAEGVDSEVADGLATTTVAAIEGAVVIALATRSTQPLDRVSRHLTELLNIHLPDSKIVITN